MIISRTIRYVSGGSLILVNHLKSFVQVEVPYDVIEQESLIENVLAIGRVGSEFTAVSKIPGDINLSGMMPEYLRNSNLPIGETLKSTIDNE